MGQFRKALLLVAGMRIFLGFAEFPTLNHISEKDEKK
jgi:hypothetical protein